MEKSVQAPAVKINKVCNTLLGGFIATSVTVLGNNAIATCGNFDTVGQSVYSYDEKTNIYHTFTVDKGIFISIPGYSNNKSSCQEIDSMLIDEEKLENFKKIESIALLKDNWNGNGARAFSDKLITRVRNIIAFLEIQPEVFPTACDSLQLEYDKSDGGHMEIEITESDQAEIFMVNSSGTEKYTYIQTNFDEINKVVREFYG